MKTYCLVIDDDNQEEYFETEVRRVLRKAHIDLIPIFINPKDRKYMKVDHSGFDRNLIGKNCINAIRQHNCSVVVSDYQIVTDNDNFNGLDILNTISEAFPYLFKVLYSGAQILDAINKIWKDLSDKISINQDGMSDTQIFDIINQLKKTARINDIIKGKGYAGTIINYMRWSPVGLQQQLLHQLKEYHDMTFKSCYPAFKGKTLEAIGVEIEKRTTLGCDFQQALIEQTIAYLIDINKA